MKSTMNMFGIKQLREQDGEYYFHNVHGHILSTMMCIGTGDKISQIKVREALPEEETPYHAWKHPDGHISLIYPSKVQVEMCFPYGSKVATLNGEGYMIQVVITETDDKINFCDNIPEAEKVKILNTLSEMELRRITPHSLMEDFHKTISKYTEICISTTIESSKITIKQKNKKENLYHITIDDEVEFYHIEFEGRQWFFKEYKSYKYIKLIIYGKVNPQ